MDDHSSPPRGDAPNRGRRTPSSGLRMADRMSYQTTIGSQSFAAKYTRKPKAPSSKASGPSTFYRDPTPPSSSRGSSLSAGEEVYDYSYDRVAPPAPIPKAPACALSRRTLFIITGAVTALVIVGVGLGVGLGLGLRKKSPTPAGTADSDTRGVDITLSSTTVPTSTPTIHPSSTGTSTDAASTSAISCPAANNTRYRVPETDKIFLRICGIDYSGAGNAVDLASVWTTNMQDCMFQCADFPGCTACGWGVIPSDPGSEHRCWLKGDLNSSHIARPGWDFAILEE